MKTNPKSKSKTTQSKKQGAKIIQLNAFQQPQQRKTGELINAVFAVAQASLWFGKYFSEKEEAQLKDLIAEHFFNGQESRKTFKELIERLSLAKRYVARKRGRYISKPQDYLNIHYPLGLAGTAAWLEHVKQVRKDVPEYNKGITTFAKALLAFIENPTPAEFYKGRKQLIDQNQFDLLQVYNNVIIKIQYPGA